MVKGLHMFSYMDADHSLHQWNKYWQQQLQEEGGLLDLKQFQTQGCVYSQHCTHITGCFVKQGVKVEVLLPT